MLPSDTTGLLPKAAKAELDVATEDNNLEERAQNQVQGASRALRSESARATADLVLVGMKSEVNHVADQRKFRQETRETSEAEAGAQDRGRDANSACYADAVRTSPPVSDTSQHILMVLEKKMADPSVSPEHIRKAVPLREMQNLVKANVPDINATELRGLIKECDTDRVMKGKSDNLCDETS